MNNIKSAIAEIKSDLIEFARDLVRIKSYSENEQEIIQFIKDKMHKLDYWDFSTNAVATIELGIPTIGFGPGEYKLAHMVNENCKISQIIDACDFYTTIIDSL